MVVNQCARYFEEGFFLLPQEKHSLLRAMAYGLSLMDSETDKINVFKNKKISLSPFQKFFKVYEFIRFWLSQGSPLTVDAHRSTEIPDRAAVWRHAILAGADHQALPALRRETWGPGLEDRKLALEYEIQDQIEIIRTEYNMYLAKFNGMILQVPLPLFLADPPPFAFPSTSCSCKGRDDHLLLLVRFV